jgi:nitroimidazol reductase NimA-like FMN-containing flavoprotein (pyridoxamine 5'-phosphate oxidase superfamily)
LTIIYSAMSVLLGMIVMDRGNIRKIILEKSERKLPREELEEYIIEFLQKQTMCVLCTSKDNVPRATPIEYYSEGTTLYMIADQGTKIPNIESNQNVSVGIFAPYTGWLSVRGVQITGKARIIAEDDPERGHALQVYRWEKTMKELGMSGPPIQKIIKVEAEKIELTDFYLKLNGYSFKQGWEKGHIII